MPETSLFSNDHLTRRRRPVIGADANLDRAPERIEPGGQFADGHTFHASGRIFDSVGWSVPQRRAGSYCVKSRSPMVSPIAMINMLFTVNSAAARGAKPVSVKILPLLVSRASVA